MVIAGGVVFSLNNDADLILLSATGKEAQVLKKYHVADSPTWAHPVIVGRQVLIKDASTLTLLSFE